jgi:hypothetical protein
VDQRGSMNRTWPSLDHSLGYFDHWYILFFSISLIHTCELSQSLTTHSLD